MKKIRQLSKRQIIALVAADIVPFLVLILGIFLLVVNTLFTFSWLFAFVLLPCGVLVLNWFSISGKAHPIIKWIVCLLLSVAFV